MSAELLTTVQTILVAGGVIGTTLAVTIGFRTRSDVDHLRASNAELRATNDEIRKVAEWEREQREHEQNECRLRIAELTGRVDALQAQITSDAIDRIVAGVHDAITTHLNNGS